MKLYKLKLKIIYKKIKLYLLFKLMDDGRKLEKIMVRYFPPGIILEFKDYDGYIDNKSIDLLNLSENSDIPYLVQQINEKEPLTIKYKSKIQKVIESN